MNSTSLRAVIQIIIEDESKPELVLFSENESKNKRIDEYATLMTNELIDQFHQYEDYFIQQISSEALKYLTNTEALKQPK